jgi:flagellar motor protein MotB
VTGIAVLFLISVHTASPESQSDEPEINGGTKSHQVGNDKTAEGQAENRRVVVRVLQNKGIAGI